jgi:hypothetical protein
MEYTENKIHKSMYFEESELDTLEGQHPEGLSSGEIVGILRNRGLKFSEATFRKYVQLGLLPRCRRVGTKGKHKGSRGVYPPGTIRQINEIKRLMARDYTIEEIRNYFAFVGGELEELRALLERILERLTEGLRSYEPDDLASSELRQHIDVVKEEAESLIARIEGAATRLKKLGQVAREAV